MHIGSIGPVVFHVSNEELFTFRGLERSRSISFPAHQVMGGRPRLQHTGRELDTLSLSILLVHQAEALQTPDARIRLLLKLMNRGEQLALVFGVNYWGLWVINSARVSHREFHGGLTLRGSVDLNLTEYN